MNAQKKLVSMQRILNPSQFRSNNPTTFNKENFLRIMSESMHKAINTTESPVKEKHVRKLLIGSFQAENGDFFWQQLPVIRLQENQIYCWKFCHVLHKMLRDGHRKVLANSFEKRQILLDCGNMWRHVEDGYGQLIFKYCTLLYNRINFLIQYPRFPNDLKVTDEQLDEIGERDVNIFFDMSCDIFDALDDILRLQELVLVTLDLKKHSSMSNSGQCHLAPLVACIQDSSLLYDYSVKILFKLHNVLPTSTLEGHRDRFLLQHRGLKSFYSNTSSLQYFRTLIQIPHLTDRPPNFLVASDLQQHVTPKVVMIDLPDRDSPNQSRLESSDQLLVDIDEASMPSSSGDQLPSYRDACQDEAPNVSMEQSGSSVSNSYVQQENDLKIAQLNARISELEGLIEELRNELETEKIKNCSLQDALTSQVQSLESNHESILAEKNLELRKLKDEMANMRVQLGTSKTAMERVQEECRRAQHDNEISQVAMKRLVKDLSDMKNEIAGRSQSKADSAIDQKTIEELTAKINGLNVQLDQKNQQLQTWAEEKANLVSAKTQLEKQLYSHQDELLMGELSESDQIIKDALNKFHDLAEKSRKVDTGIKLQVNERISQVCLNLMMAVRNLIVHSRVLQREVMGGDNVTAKNGEFYQRNSSWTEGLVSAANVVAMAAKSLVDSADRAMSGQTEFFELAAAANEVASATTQLVVAARVKADRESEKLQDLTNVAKQVKQCSGNVVDATKSCAELIKRDGETMDLDHLSLHQTKKLELETQARMLGLETELTKEREKLGFLRRQRYELESEQEGSAKT